MLFLAAPHNRAAAALDKWRAEIRAVVAAEEFYKSRAKAAAGEFYKSNKSVLCAAHVVGITDPSLYLHNRVSNRPPSFETESSNNSASKHRCNKRNKICAEQGWIAQQLF